MRILQISSAKKFGGGEKHLVDLCRGLTQKGHQVFIALRPKNEWEKKLAFLPEENIFHLPLKNALDIFSARKLARLMKEKEIEIAHAHLARDYPPVSLAVRFFPKPQLVLSRHVLFPMKSFHKFALTNVSKVIAVSRPTESEVKKIFPANKVALIPYGFEMRDLSAEESAKLEREFRSRRQIPPEAPLIGTVGELNPLKGQREFIIAAGLILKKLPGAFFLSSGMDKSRDQNYRPELEKMVRDLGLDENFVWIDWVEDMNSLYSALDIFVSASHIESFGLAIAEAMASGTAVIATRSEGAEQLIKNDVSGKLIPIDDPEKMAGAILEVLNDREKRVLFEKNARKFARENFSLERMISQTEDVYRSAREEAASGRSPDKT